MVGRPRNVQRKLRWFHERSRCFKEISRRSRAVLGASGGFRGFQGRSREYRGVSVAFCLETSLRFKNNNSKNPYSYSCKGVDIQHDNDG